MTDGIGAGEHKHWFVPVVLVALLALGLRLYYVEAGLVPQTCAR